MAIDKAITDLPVATEVQDEDLLVLEQNSVAKSVSMNLLLQYLGTISYVLGDTLYINSLVQNGNEVSY